MLLDFKYLGASEQPHPISPFWAYLESFDRSFNCAGLIFKFSRGHEVLELI